MSDAQRADAAISTVEGFPVAWPFPGDERLRWGLCDFRSIANGLNIAPGAFGKTFEDPLLVDIGKLEGQACERRHAINGAPPPHLRVERINGYFYSHTEEPDAKAMEAWRQDPPAALIRLPKYPLAMWQEQLLPPIKGTLERLEKTDFDQVGWKELQSHLEEALTLDERVEHMIGAMERVGGLPDQFLQLDRRHFGEQHLAVALDLFRGTDNPLLEMHCDFASLQRLAYALPGIRQALQAASSDVLTSLAQTATGRVFVEALNGFLEKHGRRFEFRNIKQPSWREDPAQVVALLRGEPVRPDWDPDAAHKQELQARHRAEETVRGELEACTPSDRVEYWDRLRVAREAMIVSEEYDVWMQQRCRVALRDVLLAVARRLTRSARLRRADDIWWLRLEELLCLPYAVTDWDRIVAARRAEWSHVKTITPPWQIGAVEAAAEGTRHRPAQTTSGDSKPTHLSGTPASSGVVRGKARMVGLRESSLALGDVARIEPGDVIVSNGLNPSATLLLSRGAGLVLRRESPLDRAAQVARQLGIPAIVSCGDATRVIEDGQTIEVDGDTGTVRLLT